MHRPANNQDLRSVIVARRLRRLLTIWIWLGLLAAPGLGPAEAQTPAIVAAPQITVPATGDIDFVLRIEPPGSAPAGSWIGIASPHIKLKLSAGWSLSRGWRLALTELPGLRIGALAAPGTTATIRIVLIDAEGDVLAQSSMQVRVDHAAAPPGPHTPGPHTPEPHTPEPQAAAPSSTPVILPPLVTPRAAQPTQAPQLVAPTAVVQPPAQREPAQSELVIANVRPVAAPEPPANPVVLDPAPTASPNPEITAGLQRLIDLGQRQLALGNIAIARQYFLRPAEAGSAPAALLLAETYDARSLERMGVIGVSPDAAEARRWYDRAAALGSPEAAQRLARPK